MYPTHSGHYVIDPEDVLIPDGCRVPDEPNVVRLIETLTAGPQTDIIYPSLPDHHPSVLVMAAMRIAGRR
ncbi:MAG: hypothetical protein BGO82_10270 [Devosia sp. 67-54]|nr:MAG: hypothetical protein BGO82_10270 [Devosia sp. 67-54]